MGALLGVLLSLNFSAVAQREAKPPIPYEDLQLLSAVFGQHQERLRRAGLRRQADQGSDQRDGARARPALRFPRRRRVQGAAGLDPGQVRRPRHRGRRRGRRRARRLADRGHARVPRRHQVRRPDRQDRRRRDARHAALQGGREDARQAGHRGRADGRAQGRRGAAHLHADARGDQRQERARQDARAGLRLHPRAQLPGPHRRGPRQGAEGPVQAGRPQGPRARPAQRSRAAC